MLMVTTTVGMLHRVHGNTTHLRPAVTLHLVLVVGTTGLQDGLVNTTTAGNDADHSAICRWDDLLGTRWELDTGLLGIGIVSDDGGVVARSTSQTATITGLLLQIADDGTFRHLAKWHYIANLQGSLTAAVDELASVHAFGGDEHLLADLVAIGITEVNDSQRCATTGIVNDILKITNKYAISHIHVLLLPYLTKAYLDDAANVARALGKVQRTQLGGSLALLDVRLEDGTGAFTLCTNYTTHFYKLQENQINVLHRPK